MSDVSNSPRNSNGRRSKERGKIRPELLLRSRKEWQAGKFDTDIARDRGRTHIDSFSKKHFFLNLHFNQINTFSSFRCLTNYATFFPLPLFAPVSLLSWWLSIVRYCNPVNRFLWLSLYWLFPLLIPCANVCAIFPSLPSCKQGYCACCASFEEALCFHSTFFGTRRRKKAINWESSGISRIVIENALCVKSESEARSNRMMHVLREELRRKERRNRAQSKGKTKREDFQFSRAKHFFFLSLLYSAENGFTKIYTLLKNPCHPPRSSISLTHTLAHTHAHTHAGIRLWNPPFSPFRPSSLFSPLQLSLSFVLEF